MFNDVLVARFNAFKIGELEFIFMGELFLSMGGDNMGLNMSDLEIGICERGGVDALVS